MQKKAAIITFHRALNYGAVLQAYALEKTLQGLGLRAEILDYRCPRLESIYRPMDTGHCKGVSAKGKKILKSPGLARKRRRFEQFTKARLHTSAPCNSGAALKQIAKNYPVIITGSDQVFNPDATGNDRNYFLSFAGDESKKLAYGASLGYHTFPKSCVAAYKPLLRRFDAISVRESSSRAEVAALSGKPVEHVLDPTLLLSEDEWLKIAEKPAKLPERYVLVYMMEGCRYVIEKARALAREKNAALVLINPTLKQQYSCRDFVRYTSASPGEFVGMFSGAEAVVTNSFHGVAFSLIFKKEFYAECSNIEKSARMTDLLALFGLSDKLLPKALPGAVSREQIDKVMREERNKSLQWLKNAVGGD